MSANFAHALRAAIFNVFYLCSIRNRISFFDLQEKCFQYWPHERSVRYQCYVVDPIAEYNMPQYKLREFKVTDARDGSSRTVRQFQYIDWPEQVNKMTRTNNCAFR